MNLKLFKQKLNSHDWYFLMSHDRRVYESGLASYNEILKLKEGKKTYESAYQRMLIKNRP